MNTALLLLALSLGITYHVEAARAGGRSLRERFTPVELVLLQKLNHQPVQAFGAYEQGVLVRWGPVSTGARTAPTPSGLFYLNWRQREHVSTVNPDWTMPWSFNFDNRLGLAFHEQALPGKPASHGCVRMLAGDAQWLFEWGEPWTIDPGGTRVLRLGTPVLVIGEYDFEAEPPWQSLHRLARPVEWPPQ